MMKWRCWWVLCLVPAVTAAQPRGRRRREPPAPAVLVVPAAAAATPSPPAASPAPVATPPPPVVLPAVPPSPPPLPTQSAGGYLSLRLLGGYGVATQGNAGNENASLGGGVAYTFGTRISLGAEALYHFGSSSSFSGGTLSSSAVWVGGQLGFDVLVGPLMIRPYALGGAMIETHECMGCSAPTGFVRTPAPESGPHAALGAGLGLHLLASAFFFGVDGRVLGVLDRGVALTALGTIGVRIR